jgi:SAM-dependent methyltransferase
MASMRHSLYCAAVIVERRFAMGACALLLLGAGTLFFWPIAVDGRVPVFRDIIDTTVPLGHYIGARLRAGHLPQWFPYEGMGEPFIGQLNESTFHPTSWLYAMLPLAAALRWELLLGYAAAAFGQLLFARKLGMSWTASTLAAVAFAFSGYAISLSNVLPYLWGVATLPWLGFCAAEVFTSERPWPWVAALAIFWATIVVAGDSHSALFGGLVALFAGAQTGRLRRLPLCILASLIAVGLAGAELLPAFDIVRAGPRTGWNTAENNKLLSTFWALHPYRLPELLLPGWLPLKTTHLFANARHDEGGMWALSVYAGTTVVALGLVGLLSRKRRGVLAAALALFGLWMATGIHGGLEPLLRRTVPLLTVLRYPEKYLGIWMLGLSLAAAAGLDHLREKPRWRLPIVLGAAAAACAIAAILLPADAALKVWPQLAQKPQHIPALHDAWHDALFGAALSLSLAAVILAGARRRAALLALLPATVFFDLWLANGATIGVAPANVLTDVPRFCASARSQGAGADGLRALNASTRIRKIDEMDDPGRYAAMSLNLLQPASSELCGIGSIWTYPILSNEPRSIRWMIGRQHLELNPALILYGFGLVIRAFPEDRPVSQERVVDALEIIPGEELVLVQRPAAPRAYAAVPRWVPDAGAARAEVNQQGLALVEGPVLVGPGPAFEGSGTAGTVAIAEYEPEHVVLDAQMTRPGAVILNDFYSPGWTASVDGQPARIYRANALVRGVLAQAGRHRIEMRYQLPRLRAGLAVSGASLLACVLLIAGGTLPRKTISGRSPAEDRGASGAADRGEHQLQREYWKAEDRAHYLWQTANPYIAATEAELLAGVAAREGERLLEIGCGEGANLYHLLPSVSRAALFAVDFSLAKVGFVAKLGVHAACADATRLPFRDGAFDAVLIRDLLHHVPDRARVLAEAARLLKPGGRLTVVEPNGRNPIIAAMALAVRAERGMLASSPQRVVSEAAAAGLVELHVEERQPLPLSRIVLHYRLGAPSLARFAAVRAVLRALERISSALPRSLWSYLVLTARRRDS